LAIDLLIDVRLVKLPRVWTGMTHVLRRLMRCPSDGDTPWGLTVIGVPEVVPSGDPAEDRIASPDEPGRGVRLVEVAQQIVE
jgi:hypothetical protein